MNINSKEVYIYFFPHSLTEWTRLSLSPSLQCAAFH